MRECLPCSVDWRLPARQWASDTDPFRCRNLLLGDGGYINASMETLGGERGAKQATMFPTIFDSNNWEAFRDHAFRVGCCAAVSWQGCLTGLQNYCGLPAHTAQHSVTPYQRRHACCRM
jgi:hypothetical protein